METNGYVVMELGWEYDDQGYSRNRDQDGTPVKIYTTEQEAHEEAKRLSLVWFRKQLKNGELSYYNYEDLPYDKDGEAILPSEDCPDEEALEFMRNFLSTYEVVKVG